MQTMKRIIPTSDLAMKKVLTTEGNEDILSGLINDFFDISAKPEEISIENPYSIEAFKEIINKKQSKCCSRGQEF